MVVRHKQYQSAVGPHAAPINAGVVESGILADLKQELLFPAVIEEARKRVIKALKVRGNRPAVDPKRIGPLEREVRNLTDAVASGALRTSPALGARLTLAELNSHGCTRPPRHPG